MLKTTDKFIFLIIFSLLLFLALNRHSKHQTFNYHAELWVDKAGYQVFLPALFYYDFNADEFPDGIQQKIGNGFRLDHKTNKVRSKYPIGVAVLQLPFFTLGALIDKIKGETEYLGYTIVQHKMIDLSTIFYCVLALLFLFKAFIKEHNRKRIYLLLFLLIFASNLYFYITRDAGLSHAYSFFVFTLFFYHLKRLVEDNIQISKRIIYALFFASLGCLIRPSNVVLYLLAGMVFVVPHAKQIWANRRDVLRGLGPGILLAMVLPVVQLFYYKYAFGDFLAYSYSDESFIYALKPKIARVWFAPGNGLFLYSPIYILALCGLLVRFKSHKLQSMLYAALFLGVSYLYAAWWTPGLGCGYGHRGFIELLPFFSIPILSLLYTIKTTSLRIGLSVFGLCYVFILVYFQYQYDGCWYGNGYWDWAEIPRILGLNWK